MDYGAIHYYISAGTFGPIDSFFAEIGKKLSLLEHQTETTNKLYAREKNQSHRLLKETFDADMTIASTKYDLALDEVLGSDDIKHSYAAHESGMGMITGRYAMECEQLDLRFAEMQDNLYKSAIISLYVLLETEMKKLCHVWRSLTGHKIALTDFGYRDYLGASYKYLDLVMDLDMTRLATFQNKLTDLQNLRNRLVHDGSFIKADQLKTVKKLIDSSGKGLILVPQEEAFFIQIVDPLYVNNGYRLIRGFFEQLFWLIDEATSYRFLNDRLQYLFGVLNRHITIEKLKVSGTTSDGLLQFTVESNDFDSLYDFEVKIAIKNAATNKISITNYVTGNEQIDRLVVLLNENHHLFWDRAFAGFFLRQGGQAVHFTFTNK